MNKVINIDVDLCVVNPVFGREGYDWFSYLRRECIDMDVRFYDDLENGRVNYDLGSYFTLPDGICAFDFWRDKDMYQNFQPLYGAKKYIDKLSKDNIIIFTSYCKANHYKSKYLFLKEYFPYLEGFYATKNKRFVRSDIFIDDRNNFINQQYDDVICIKYNTPYTQDEPLTREVKVCDNWKEIYEYIRSKD
jgi:5'(3')-deoxyribonucleotidase